jgi:hypothetical protein
MPYRLLGDSVSDVGASADELAALRVAVLRWHERFLDPGGSLALRVAGRLQRLHLTWLALPLALPLVLVDFVRMFWRLRPGRLFDTEGRAVGLYRQLSGKDPHVARAEVWRIGSQLRLLDERDRGPDGDRPGAPRGADPVELEAAAAALIGYYLAGRHSDDALLGEVETAWAEYEELQERRRQRGMERRGRRWGRRRRRRVEAATDERAYEAATERYLVAWRRWLDRPTRHGGPAAVGDP